MSNLSKLTEKFISMKQTILKKRLSGKLKNNELFHTGSKPGTDYDVLIISRSSLFTEGNWNCATVHILTGVPGIKYSSGAHF